MEQVITIKIPCEWVNGLPDEELIYRQIIRLGIHRYKVERAIEMYHDGIGSVGYVSEKIGVIKQDLIRELRLRNIEPEFSEETIQEELSE